MKPFRKVVLVTGASRGIGREIALAFAGKGYRVGINFKESLKEAEILAKEIEKLGADSILLKADISHSDQVKTMIKKVIDRWGKVDVLVNNVGLVRDRSILKMTDQEWLEPLQVNLTGAFWCLRESAKGMVKKKEGSIINISSIVGVLGSFGGSNYAASKAGLINLTKSAAKELGRFNIRVNAILPGFHLTDMGKTLSEELIDKIRSAHVLGKFTDLSQLAQMIVTIAEQTSISGQVFNCDSRIL
ncbi:MAG: 3-oxoacyl-ACP reductase FabG [Elusimicrobia bacterium]|nr:3-oxoacyl-ACP reductase FabG [Elusimicrobiota bacterium]